MVLADSNIHRLHHSIDPVDYDRNFAAYFPIWDIIFGTFKYPHKPVKTGLKERSQYWFVK
jgi:sterol desaturase/sphingolipid hydroxylase (fatty acid hydroxylase superfamily)